VDDIHKTGQLHALTRVQKMLDQIKPYAEKGDGHGAILVAQSRVAQMMTEVFK
jgi:hypothetical protein